MGRFRDRTHQLFVGGDEHGAGRTCTMRGAGDVRQQPGLKPGRNARQGQRRFGAEDFLEIGHKCSLFNSIILPW